ncbi:hypothetical protein [Dyadobacter fermentans]|uniref:HEAT repeat domain-containing protein n=1 Tax=Dyadobacter fermentans (strain ATCC 700827 / DSM 18053 / CIP 107007 / KCTC 52180 / NS114) TaxID=471854 RepID=C6W1B6_DYAFD|nr:hypothetical protein [Dyadobacter fermentans]ACT91973.1 hypothetical protein Dfer_0711 [Dyadobacter fermentans DSM 18053]
MRISGINIPKSIRRMVAVWAIAHGSLPCLAQIRYFQPASIPGTEANVVAIPSAVQDSIVTDTIFQVWSKEGYPLRYYKKIRTSVCFDNKCRLLKCTLYWNVTGRYLGLELEKGEFLSKARHKPFKRKEYLRLHAILADESSRLSVLSYGELAPRAQPKAGGKADVDAVTSATAASILDDVVPGAAYTTYKMWHVVYGASQQEVRDLTIRSLSPALIEQLLDSPDATDKIWALDHIRGNVRLSPELRGRLFSLINGGQYNLAERAINALDRQELDADTVQAMLAGKLAQGSYAIRKLILGKFAQASHLTEQAVAGLMPVLNGNNPELTNNVLDLFAQHRIADPEISREVAALLTRENAFVAKKAYKYLAALPSKSADVAAQMDAFRKEHLQE